MRQLFPPRRRRRGDNGTVEIMNDKQRTRAALERAQREGTHNPAVECSCGTWHTPGVAHIVNDTGAVSKSESPVSRRHGGS